MPEENGRGLVQAKARAAALVVYRDGADMIAIEDKVRALVLNSVSNLDFEDVSVVLSRSADATGAPDQPTPVAQPDQPERGPAGAGGLALLAGVALAMIGSLRLLRLPKKRPPVPALPGRTG